MEPHPRRHNNYLTESRLHGRNDEIHARSGRGAAPPAGSVPKQRRYNGRFRSKSDLP
jgi:hypothetical protein